MSTTSLAGESPSVKHDAFSDRIPGEPVKDLDGRKHNALVKEPKDSRKNNLFVVDASEIPADTPANNRPNVSIDPPNDAALMDNITM